MDSVLEKLRVERKLGRGLSQRLMTQPLPPSQPSGIFRSPAPNSNLVRLLEAESALARHESNISRGSLPMPLTPNQGQARRDRTVQKSGPEAAAATQERTDRSCECLCSVGYKVSPGQEPPSKKGGIRGKSQLCSH